MLVEQQGEHLNTIVENADTTVAELERGNKHVDSAIKKARATRAKKWGCFFLTIILAVVIVGGVVGLGQNLAVSDHIDQFDTDTRPPASAR